MTKQKADTDVLSRHVYPEGKVIFRADELGLSAYLIKSGSIEIYRTDEDQDITIAVLQPGEIFGEMALFNNGRRSTSARVKTMCELVTISPTNLEKLIAEADPGVKALLRVLVKRISDVSAKIEVCPYTGGFKIKEGKAAEVQM